MSAEGNVALIQEQFEAFGRGDMNEALAGIADDVDWQAPVTGHDCDLPWAGRRRGHAEVIEYFRQIPDQALQPDDDANVALRRAAGRPAPL